MDVFSDWSSLFDNFVFDCPELVFVVHYDELFDAVDQLVDQIPLLLLLIESARCVINSNPLVAFPSRKVVSLLLPVVFTLFGEPKVGLFQFIHTLGSVKERLDVCGDLLGKPVKIDEVIHVVFVEQVRLVIKGLRIEDILVKPDQFLNLDVLSVGHLSFCQLVCINVVQDLLHEVKLLSSSLLVLSGSNEQATTLLEQSVVVAHIVAKVGNEFFHRSLVFFRHKTGTGSQEFTQSSPDHRSVSLVASCALQISPDSVSVSVTIGQIDICVANIAVHPHNQVLSCEHVQV